MHVYAYMFEPRNRVLLERTFSCMLYFEVQTLFYRDFLRHSVYTKSPADRMYTRIRPPDNTPSPRDRKAALYAALRNGQRINVPRTLGRCADYDKPALGHFHSGARSRKIIFYS